jgi:arylsulfatase A-like enzyme
VSAGAVNEDIVLNVDFPHLFLDLAGVDVPDEMQGRSFRPLLRGETPEDWRQAMYYRYWMHKAHHNVYAHYGVRTKEHKLIYYYSDALGQEGAIDETYEPEWELFDLVSDPYELNNVVDDPAYVETTKDLKDLMHRLQDDVRDERYYKDTD